LNDDHIYLFVDCSMHSMDISEDKYDSPDEGGGDFLRRTL